MAFHMMENSYEESEDTVVDQGMSFGNQSFYRLPVKYGDKTFVKEFLSKLPEGVFVAGGFVRELTIYETKADDIDLFVTGETAYANLVNFFNKLGFSQKFESRNTITFEEKNAFGFVVRTYQIIKPSICKGPDLESILKQFDFSVNRAGLIDAQTALVDVDFECDNEEKKLRIKYVNNPLSISARVSKYITKGFTINTKELYKMFQDWDFRNQDYKDRLLYSLNEIPSNNSSFGA